VAWLHEGLPGLEPLDAVSTRLTLATGLEVARRSNLTKHREVDLTFAAEALQVGVYGPGGLYLPHTDAYFPTDVRRKRRFLKM
jgi:hypothetical protein